MSDNPFDMFDDDDTDGASQAPTPGALRKWAEKTQAENKELRERLATLEANERRTSFSEVLSGAGKDPAAVSLIPSDITDAEGVTKWLESHGSFIRDAEKPAPQTPEADQEQHEENQQVLSDEDAKKLAAVSGAPNGVPPGAQQNVLDKLNTATSEREFYEMLEGLEPPTQ